MFEVVIVPTYKREELLHCCLRRVREQDERMPILVFSDRGEITPNLQGICYQFAADLIVQPTHEYYGNTFSAGEALRFAYLCGYEVIHYLEDDTFIRSGFFDWTRKVHSDFDNIFCSCGWTFNRFAPIVDETYFASWIYIPQFTITRKMLELALPHLNPLYYARMKKYISRNFAGNPLQSVHPQAIQHYELDGLLQRVMMESKLQVAWNSIAKVEHMGFAGYNRGGYLAYEDFFQGEKGFAKRVELVEDLVRDPYYRMHIFGREIVERELGYEVPERQFRYRMAIGEYSSEFTSSLLPHQLPKTINSVPRTPETEIVVAS